ncbi:A/G-specific adenine glycosylase [Streptococcus pantholopis]|uniref:Adenine DNA glycosylase n=1 Tax=Streptococcus pantholopis TaxID=1811193 RepID=A0A172Q5E2_9STRE|nr:A/G-specific adenine glycosylase [Streptococcus pantholopis]AND78645.1 A/G-specific adenine glycosylase [Streptococcus pantholopis]
MIDLKAYGIVMWDESKIASFRRTLLNWYDREKRDLPWRRTKNPYKIWISEIMLQQTQVQTVIPYYERFLDCFPTVTDLAAADEEKLLKAWEGLGYYSRVRNMQKAARQIVEEYQGHFPANYEQIAQLKGIGPYTAGAIASIAFDLPEPAVDGNVMRVLSRLFEIDYDIGQPKNRKIFQALMEILIDPNRPGDFNQALMDLGSDIESAKNPRPEESPVRFFSAAYLNGTMDKYPIKRPKKKPQPVQIQAFIIRNETGDYLLEKNKNSRLLEGFWSFPLMETSFIVQPLTLFDDSADSLRETLFQKKVFEEQYQISPSWSDRHFSQLKHVFSHRKWQIELTEGLLAAADIQESETVRWVSAADFVNYPFAAPQQKILDEYLKHDND